MNAENSHIFTLPSYAYLHAHSLEFLWTFDIFKDF